MTNIRCTWTMHSGKTCPNWCVSGTALCISHTMASRALNGGGPRINHDRFPRPISSSPPMRDSDIEAIGAALNRNEVRYVVIGGIASELHGAVIDRSRDMDICALRLDDDHVNLIRVIAFLEEVRAVPKNWPADIPPPAHNVNELLLTRFANYETDHGPFDISFTPSGFDGGYEQLAVNAVTIRFGEVDLQVASLEDIIKSKTAANRDKDVITLPALRQRKKWLDSNS